MIEGGWIGGTHLFWWSARVVRVTIHSASLAPSVILSAVGLWAWKYSTALPPEGVKVHSQQLQATPGLGNATTRLLNWEAADQC